MHIAKIQDEKPLRIRLRIVPPLYTHEIIVCASRKERSRSAQGRRICAWQRCFNPIGPTPKLDAAWRAISAGTSFRAEPAALVFNEFRTLTKLAEERAFVFSRLRTLVLHSNSPTATFSIRCALLGKIPGVGGTPFTKNNDENLRGFSATPGDYAPGRGGWGGMLTRRNCAIMIYCTDF